ncbi:MAG: beta-propeller fold lactonase family protein [Gammaproteobacteria bacterium]|nr:beta-propeller fold lactonase family protein [Gammaproteobacteria bacterium]
MEQKLHLSGCLNLWGHFSYTSNTGSGTITGFAVDGTGQLTLLDSDGRTADVGAGTAPTDLALTRGGRFLYSRNSGNGSISGFRVDHDGKLSSVGTVAGLPAGANGLIAY